mmetsp:Transcript_43447/g.95086  ORF Transcript_43447/g.95086 Transcript_43447/m.95086 type:complete len:252 (+) Transcript_43447:214-969(+)
MRLPDLPLLLPSYQGGSKWALPGMPDALRRSQRNFCYAGSTRDGEDGEGEEGKGAEGAEGAAGEGGEGEARGGAQEPAGGAAGCGGGSCNHPRLRSLLKQRRSCCEQRCLQHWWRRRVEHSSLERRSSLLSQRHGGAARCESPVARGRAGRSSRTAAERHLCDRSVSTDRQGGDLAAQRVLWAVRQDSQGAAQPAELDFVGPAVEQLHHHLRDARRGRAGHPRRRRRRARRAHAQSHVRARLLARGAAQCA